ASVEGVLQASYNFQEYKSKKKDAILSNISFISDLENADEVVKSTWNVLKGIDLTRDLVNTPANDLYPETLADKVNETFQDTAVEVEIFDKAALQELGAEAILAVSQGSSKEPRMIVLKYMPLGPDEPVISLVGKGVTYDSGGYALKTARGMATMMTDMAGAAAMIGTVQALAANDVQKNVIAVIGATENLISGEAFKNGDIINTLKGTTVEVLNTDAEGRLVLADVLYYTATEFKPTFMIDAATLTGAVIAALGENMTGALTNDQDLLDKVLDASKLVGEDMWQLPITDEFREKMKGNNADLTNAILAPVGAGTISASAFLENFVEDIPWVHLDIAGTSYAGSKGNKYLPKGASGIPVKTLYQFIKDLD
ncbi:MAG TPA: leucyl aminopeptidase, partial [Atopostipes sp.]|nr:leucyl aminopeptidase [Atopostipes sp.]